MLNSFYISTCQCVYICSLGNKSPNQLICRLVASAFPCTVWVCIVAFRPFFSCSQTGRLQCLLIQKLTTIVHRYALEHLFESSFVSSLQTIKHSCHALLILCFELEYQLLAAHPLCHYQQACPSFAYNAVHLPMVSLFRFSMPSGRSSMLRPLRLLSAIVPVFWYFRFFPSFFTGKSLLVILKNTFLSM